MHELSLAINIVEIAEENAQRERITHFDEIVLEVGTLSGVVIEALETAMDSAKKNTVLHNAEIIIESVQAIACCSSCQHEFIAEDIFSPCPKCGNPFSNIIKGKELKVKSLRTDKTKLLIRYHTSNY